MPLATVNQTLLVVVADVPSASLSPVVHADPSPQQPGATPAALADGPTNVIPITVATATTKAVARFVFIRRPSVIVDAPT
jgi:hypothetical protein